MRIRVTRWRTAATALGVAGVVAGALLSITPDAKAAWVRPVPDSKCMPWSCGVGFADDTRCPRSAPGPEPSYC
jgi:hypothetical protein